MTEEEEKVAKPTQEETEYCICGKPLTQECYEHMAKGY
jgi:hypothetical protein|tara:strand:+ start:533 stop:646 length:114 start_codon:yes stop_codon:yes gene_type:complete